MDFYTALIYHTIGLPANLFPLLYCIPKVAGWLAHWMEFQDDPEARMVRPCQNYDGHGKRELVEVSEREEGEIMLETMMSHWRVRRDAAKQYSHDSQNF